MALHDIILMELYYSNIMQIELCYDTVCVMLIGLHYLNGITFC